MCNAADLHSKTASQVVQEPALPTNHYATAGTSASATSRNTPAPQGYFHSCSPNCCHGHPRELLIPLNQFDDTEQTNDVGLQELHRRPTNGERPLRVEETVSFPSGRTPSSFRPLVVAPGKRSEPPEELRRRSQNEMESRSPQLPVDRDSRVGRNLATSFSVQVIEADDEEDDIPKLSPSALVLGGSDATAPETTPEPETLRPEMNHCSSLSVRSMPSGRSASSQSMRNTTSRNSRMTSLYSGRMSEFSRQSSGPEGPTPAMHLCQLALESRHVIDSVGLAAQSGEKVILFGSTRWDADTDQRRSQEDTRGEGEIEGPLIEAEFEDKFLEHSAAGGEHGLKDQLSRLGVGIACKKARKPDMPNQDNIFYCRAGDITICGIADGHGESGHWASHWVARFAIRLMLLEIGAQAEEGSRRPCHLSDTVLARNFNISHEALKHRAEIDDFDVFLSGTTLSICVVDHSNREVMAAWVGDSRCVLSTAGLSLPRDVQDLTKDHKPQDIEERRRIYERGGQIADGRVWLKGKDSPGLAMSRSLGDMCAHTCGVIHMPHTRRIPPPEDSEPRLLLCCSDGVWEFMDGAEAVDLVAKMGIERVSEATEALAAQAREVWLREEKGVFTDDISVVAVWF